MYQTHPPAEVAEHSGKRMLRLSPLAESFVPGTTSIMLELISPYVEQSATAASAQ
jgi:hypothetical protein